MIKSLAYSKAFLYKIGYVLNNKSITAYNNGVRKLHSRKKITDTFDNSIKRWYNINE